MSRQIPMGACLALLKAFDPAAYAATPQQTIATAAAAVEAALGEQPTTDLNNGQFAALIDHYLWKGAEAFEPWTPLVEWVVGGNYAKPPRYMTVMGRRGIAERDVWNVGADA